MYSRTLLQCYSLNEEESIVNQEKIFLNLVPRSSYIRTFPTSALIGSRPVLTRIGTRVKISTRIPALAIRIRERLRKKVERMTARGQLQLFRAL